MAVEIPRRPDPPLPVAISECLTGAAVRYDGSDARSRFPHEALDGLLSHVPICPEVGIGMGVPRPPIQLVGDPNRPRVLGVENPDIDVTADLEAYARARSGQLRELYGYVFMERSPSCGLYSVPVRGVGGAPLHSGGRGVYAREVSRRHPRLPMEENGRLFEHAVRESFLARVFAYAHWRRLREAGLTPARLMEFHSRYKYLLMAHSVPHYRQAGRLLGNADGHGWRSGGAGRNERGSGFAEGDGRRSGGTEGGEPRAGVADEHGPPDPAGLPSPGAASNSLSGKSGRYLECLLEGLSKPASRGSHTNVLSHLQGYLSRGSGASARRELAAAIEQYRRGGAPLAKPRELLLRQLEKSPHPYLDKQVYLRPPWSLQEA